jgi:hypothetical protein
VPFCFDVQACISADWEMVPPIMALVVDVEKAHQQVPVAEEDWRHVACSADPMPGTYGVASASWHWTRVASLFQRIAYYFTGFRYLFRFADDFMMLSSDSTGVGFTLPILRFILLVGLCEIPLKWPKTRGGFESRICWLPLPL